MKLTVGLMGITGDVFGANDVALGRRDRKRYLSIDRTPALTLMFGPMRALDRHELPDSPQTHKNHDININTQMTSRS
jgi:hypothetical protein